MPTPTRGGPERYLPLALPEPQLDVPQIDRGFWSDLGDTYATESMWVSGYNAVERILSRRGMSEPGYDGLDHVPEGYEAFADDYAWSQTPEETRLLTEHIDEMNAARRRRSSVGLGSSLGYSLLAGVFDPINLIAGPAVRGLGFAKGALKGGASIGTINAASELVRHSFDPTATWEETGINITAGYFIGGLIGGGIGHFTRGKGVAPGAGTVTDGDDIGRLSVEQRARADETGNQFNRVLNAVDGTPVDEVMEVGGHGVKVVVGSTGKLDANGNPVRAFMRKKGRMEADAHAAKVSRAADSALGDVIPERPTGDDAARLDELGEQSVTDDAMVAPEIGAARAAGDMDDAALPFGREGDEAGPDGARTAKPDEPFEDTIFIDIEGLWADFGNKPWTTPRLEGVAPLADDAFKTEAEWVNFVFLHELNHKTTLRNQGESLAEYENRINRMAFEEVQAGRLPLSPTDSFLETVALAPMPSGNLMRLAPRNDDVHSLAQGVAGDHATQVIAARAGRAAVPGGSVYQRSLQWTQDYFKGHIAIRRGYEEYIHGYQSTSPMMTEVNNLRARAPLVGTAKRDGKMTYAEFNDFVGKAVFDDDPFVLHGRTLDEGEMAVVRKAAGEVREVLDKIEREALDLGMFDRQKRLQWEIDWRAERIEEIKREMKTEAPLTEGQIDFLGSKINEYSNDIDAMLDLVDEMGPRSKAFAEDKIARRNQQIEGLREKLDNAHEPRPPSEGRLDNMWTRLNEMAAKMEYARANLKNMTANTHRFAGDDHYWHRVFDQNKIRANKEKFVDTIAMGYARETGDANAITPEIRERAQKTADRILGDGVEEHTYGYGGVRQLKSRAIPLSNKELAEFIVLDADSVLQSYVRRIAPAIEMTRAYGSTNMAKQIDALEAKLIKKRVPAKKREAIQWEIEALRDRVLNVFHAKDPLSWDNRLARALKNYGNLTVLGRSIYAQSVEVFRTIAAEGYEPLFKALHASFEAGFKGVQRGSYARIAGEAFEYANARALARAMEADNAVLASRQTWVERKLAAAQFPLFVGNMMTPFTVMWKEFTGIMVAHRLMRDSQKLANALRSGKTLATLSKSESKISSELASWGIDARRAQMIADMPVDKTKAGLLLPNIDAWEGTAGEAAKDAFRGALSGNIRSNVTTPGPMQRPAAFDGIFKVGDGRMEIPLVGVAAHLMSFPWSASAKITHAVLSGRDRNRYVTLTSLLAGGYFSSMMVAGDSWDHMDWQEKIAMAIDRSGALGYIYDPIKRVEALTGYGPRAAMGLDQFGEGEVAPKVGAVAGPGAGILAGVVEAFASDDLEDRRRTSNIKRGVIFSGMIYWNDYLKDLSDAAAAGGFFEEDYAVEPAPDPEAMLAPAPD